MYGHSGDSSSVGGHFPPAAGASNQPTSASNSHAHDPPAVPGYGGQYGYCSFAAHGYAAPDYGNVNHSAASYGAAYGDAMQTTPSPRTSTLGATPMAVDTPSPMPAVTTAAPPAEQQLDSVQRCHMHTKPDLNCKFCRKYKSAVHELSRLAAQRSSSQPAEKPNQLPMTNSSTYNLNTLLLNNILSSEYYKSLATMNSYVDVVNELAQYADHAEPYCNTATRAPSTLFCCLHKLFTLRLTEKQMSALVDCTKSPYPRCCGFLYLRFVLPSDQLWDWFEPYLMDDESFVISVNPTRNTTIGEFCERLLVDEKYFNTVLPRLPTRFKNRYGPHLCSMAEHRRRRAENLENIDNFVAGETCSAFVRGEWVEGVIVSVSQYYPTVAVQLGADKQEDLDIGYVSLNKAHSKRSRGTESSTEHRHGGASGASSASKEDLLREFKRRQSERALAVGKDYAKRPSSFKSSLSSKMDKHGR